MRLLRGISSYPSTPRYKSFTRRSIEAHFRPQISNKAKQIFRSPFCGPCSFWICTVAFVVVRCMFRVSQAAIAYQVFRVIYHCFYQTEEDEFLALIFSARLEPKSFVVLLCLLLTVHSLFKEVIGVLRERVIAPFSTTIVDCPDCRESRIKSYIESIRRRKTHIRE
ncbi:hypothetical protein N7461_004485 [Penicillium sp. DV-2018c]|nr:hypothetical protein N7461_004485 [Penicillium sp. DV-2018c]